MQKLYFLLLCLLLAALGANSIWWQSWAVGALGLVFYFWLTARPAGRWLQHFFCYTENIPQRFWGVFGSFLLVSSLSGGLVVTGFFSSSAVIVVLALNACFWPLVCRMLPIKKNEIEFYAAQEKFFIHAKLSWGLGLAYAVLVLLGLGLLLSSRSSGVISAPWQVIHPIFIYVFAAATFILGLLIFSRLGSRLLLVLFMVHGLLMHSYLPLTHTLLYGADSWRHLATEERLVRGEGTFKPEISDTVSAPNQDIDLGLVSYSQLWGITSVLAGLTGASLLWLNQWLVPILWALVLPLLLYEFACTLRWSRELTFGLIFLSFLPFALTSAGSFTLPVSFGFLSWLFFILLLVKRLVKPETGQRIVLGFLCIQLCGGYALYALLAVIFFIVAELFLQLQNKAQRHFNGFFAVIVGLSIVGITVFIPLLEYFAGYNTLVPTTLWFGQLKQFVGNFTAAYVAAGPRPHDIATGNIIFNQVPLASFVTNLFTWTRWPLVGFMLAWWGLCIRGWYYLLQQRGAVSHWFAVVSGGVFGAYVLGRYFFQGEQVLTRRLEVVVALAAIFLVCSAVLGLSDRYKLRYSKNWLLVVLGVVSLATSASFTLGPDTLTVSNDQYQAMKWVHERVGQNQAKCVLAETFPLLALEALSRKEIIGGGFPISHDFEQPEQQKLYTRLAADPLDNVAVGEALQLTDAEHCFLVAPLNEEVVAVEPAAKFGTVAVWEYGK